MIKSFSSAILAAGILLVGYYSLLYFFPNLEHRQFFAFLIYFSGLEILSTLAYKRFQTESDAEKFVMTFMVVTGVKFILSLFIVLILVIKFPEQKQLLALSFCAQYLIFLVLDSAALLSKIKQRN